MKVTMLLADAAAAVQGKLYILGGGWSITGPTPTPFAIAIKIEVPWDEANKRHKLALELFDADGNPVKVRGEHGEEPVRVEGEFEVGRPPGLKPGTPLDFTLAIGFGPIPLPPDSRFAWRLSIDGYADELWQVAFSTRPALK
jgi:hypothetical protein